MIVAIDGPAASGKSTVAKSLACRLGMAYLDTGAMYRAIAVEALRRGIALDDDSGLSALAREVTVSFVHEEQLAAACRRASRRRRRDPRHPYSGGRRGR